MSLQTRQVRANLVRAAYCYKSPEGKLDAATGKEKERKTKWDKRFIIVSETTPAGVYWYKNESVRSGAMRAMTLSWYHSESLQTRCCCACGFAEGAT